MARSYVAFDIETAKDVPGTDFNWKPHRPLGISCAATWVSGEAAPRLWHGLTRDGTPAPRMSPSDAAELLAFLDERLAQGCIPLSWNGLAFDYDIIAEEAVSTAACRRQAESHVDMMFHIVCLKGFPISLANAAAGMNLEGKSQGISGILVPQMWAEGRFQEVLAYVAQDVRMTLAIAEEAEKRNELFWKTRKGTLARAPLPNGWLTVKEALRLKEPDTSWMTDPPRRSSFYEWFSR